MDSNAFITSCILQVILYILSTDNTHAHSVHRNKLLLVTYDGFRWDYLTYTDTPNFDSVVLSGSGPPYMDGVYPSNTLPSLYSIATGLYPESHGLINNEMYDPILKASFNYSVTDSVWYEDAEPIWVTAKRQGLKTAGFYFPGIDAEIHGYRPDIWRPYNGSVKFDTKVDQVISWFEKDNVDFAILYFNQPDVVAHSTGPAPQSNDTLQMIKYCDEVMGYLLNQIEEHNLTDSLNMMVFSDHGFTAINKVIDLYEFIHPDDVEIIKPNNILPKEGKLEQVYNDLQKMHPNVTIYKKEDIPDHFHYKHNRRILPIVIMPDEGIVITKNKSTTARKGTHGFDNRLMSMKPFFTAMGPNIKKNFTSPVFSQIDIYSLMCKLLVIEPSTNNGSLDLIGQILIDDDVADNHTEYSLNQYALLTLTGLGAVLCILGIVYLVSKRYRPKVRYPNGSPDISYSKVPSDYVPL